VGINKKEPALGQALNTVYCVNASQLSVCSQKDAMMMMVMTGETGYQILGDHRNCRHFKTGRLVAVRLPNCHEVNIRATLLASCRYE
jgi:hypothetical protein